MAGGIDWFRWHHGSVTDPKFQLVAKRAGVRTSDVIAVWAFLLEKASAAEFRSDFGEVDCEAVDCLLGMDDGSTAAILLALTDRKLIAEGYIVAWEKRQPKREREDDTAAQRKRDQRARDAATPSQPAPSPANAGHVTPRHAASHQKTPREEKSREEKEQPTPASGGVVVGLRRFQDFWAAWPQSTRKGGKGKCEDVWAKRHLDAEADDIVAHVSGMSQTAEWRKEAGQYVPAPLVYLNGRRWDGADLDGVASRTEAFEGAV